MDEHDRTYLGLHSWAKALFQKLGWMIVIHNEHNIEQLKCYVTSIETLVRHIDIKLDYLKKLCKKQEHPEIIFKIHDIEILKHNILILHKHAHGLVKSCKEHKHSKKKMLKGGS